MSTLRVLCLVGGFCALFGTANIFAAGKRELVNTQTIPSGGITAFTVSYESGDMVFFESETGDFVLKEYMDKNRKDWYAQISSEGGNLSIVGAKRKMMSGGGQSLIELYVPKTYRGDYLVTLTSGSIKSEIPLVSNGVVSISQKSGDLNLKAIQCERVGLYHYSGSIVLGSLRAPRSVHIQQKSGNVTVVEAQSDALDISVVSGSLDIQQCDGVGRFSMESGNITVAMTRVSGDLYFDMESGSIDLSLPRAGSFTLNGAVESGSIIDKESGAVIAESRTGSHQTVQKNTVIGAEGGVSGYSINTFVRSGTMVIAR